MADLGLSRVHISQQGAGHGVQATAGEFRGQAERVPCNGWGGKGTSIRSASEQARLALVSDGVSIHRSPGDSLGTVRRDLRCVSVGVVPVLAVASKRGRVQRFSAGSASRLVRYLSNALADYRYFGTLTVPGNWCERWSNSGSTFKRQLDEFLKYFIGRQRELAGDASKASVCWWLEFQARGAPHVHCLYTEWQSWRDLACRWAMAVDDLPSMGTMTRFEEIRGGRAGMAAYARKYACKTDQKDVPDGYTEVGRFWGVRGYRETCTCHVILSGLEDGGQMVEGVEAICEAGVATGVLGRVHWSRGDGWVYFVRGRAATLYSVGIGQQIDLLLCRLAAKHGGLSHGGSL